MINLSVIIPHKDSLKTLLRLLKTIPNLNNLEVLVIDDKSNNKTKSDLQNQKFNDNVKIIFSELGNGSGSARNIGINNSSGTWVIFADADDVFSDNFVEIISQFFNNTQDIIYFGTNSLYESGGQSYRHSRYMKLITGYLKNHDFENKLRFQFLAPWGKMIRRELLINHNIRFEKILSGEDNLFSIKVAEKAKTITATSQVLYILTHTSNSLSTIFNKSCFDDRFNAALEANKYLRSINQSKYQQSILYFVGRSYKFGFNYFLHVIKQLIIYRSNIFIGYQKIFNFLDVIKKREY